MNKLICVFLSLLFVTTCIADFFYVNANGTGDYPTIQAAIDDANDGDTIFLMPGTYTNEGNRDVNFIGKAVTIQSIEPNDPCIVKQTIIDCNGSKEDHHRGFLFNNFEDANSVLDGLTIKNGYQHEGGGAIACLQASPTIKNCVITENTSFGKGAGMYIDGAGMIIDQPNPIIINCTFSYNNVLACLLSTGGGAGINMADSSPEIIDCKFIANAGGCGGGGIAIWWSGRPKIIDCTFKENFEALGTNVGGNPSLIGCSFINNNYGAIYGGNLLVTNCVFADNSHTFDGGAVRLWSGTTSSTFNNCLFYNNSADERGGAVFLGGANDVNFINCTFSKNQAPSGDAISCDSYEQRSPSELQLTNCILWNGTDSIWNNDGSKISVSYSNVQGGWPNGGNIQADPCFADLDSNDFHLLGNSPCIDVGDNSAVTESTDLDGRDRIVDGDCNSTNIVDMGAYEFTTVYYGDFDGDCDVEFIDYSILANFYMTDEFSVDIAPAPAGDGMVDENELAILCENWLCSGYGCGGSRWTELTYDDFESGWGNWVSGGADCMLYEGGEHAHQPNNAVNIQDDSKIESSFQLISGIDVNTPGYTQIQVDFWFKAVRMEVGEDFFLQYRDGSKWHRIKTYVRGNDDIVNGEFINDKFYHETVYINEADYIFPNNMKIRFKCHASGNVDDVYIDEITISAR